MSDKGCSEVTMILANAFIGAVLGAFFFSVAFFLARNSKYKSMATGVAVSLAVAVPSILSSNSAYRNFINRNIGGMTPFESEMDNMQARLSKKQEVRQFLSTAAENPTYLVQRITQDGMYYLSLDDLDKWNDLRLRLANSSTHVCAGFMRGGIVPSDLMGVLNSLNEQEAKYWVDLIEKALLLGIQNNENHKLKDVREQFMPALETLQAALDKDELAKMKENLISYMAKDEETICSITKTIHENAPKLNPEDRKKLLSVMAALR